MYSHVPCPHATCVLTPAQVTGPPNAADIAAIKSQFAATMLGSLAERLQTECSKWAPGGDLITCFPCAEGACCGCLRPKYRLCFSKCERSREPKALAVAALQRLGLARAFDAGLRPHHWPLQTSGTITARRPKMDLKRAMKGAPDEVQP